MLTTIPALVRELSKTDPDIIAQKQRGKDRVYHSTSYKELYQEVQSLAAGLQKHGVSAGDFVGLIADNKKQWLLCDLSILSLGAADVPRGTDTMTNDLKFILGIPDCKIVICDTKNELKKILEIKEELPLLEKVIIIDSCKIEETGGLEILFYEDVYQEGIELLRQDPLRIEAIIDTLKPEDLATLIFTSGTTGEPKGVMITHKAFLNQAENLPPFLGVKKGDSWLCVLPVWHSFERAMQYIALFCVSTLAYSKPIGKIMLADMKDIKPNWIAAVPRIWEALYASVNRNIKSKGPVVMGLFSFFTSISALRFVFDNQLKDRLPRVTPRVPYLARLLDICIAIFPWLGLSVIHGLGNLILYKKIKTTLGGGLKAGISGGGALSSSIDRFFNGIGVRILEGYGLTETAPIIGVRTMKQPVLGTVGQITPNMEIEIRDDKGKALGFGKKGVVFAKGPQVMKGYYKRPELTANVLGSDGWLNTGDMGVMTYDKNLILVGRAKDTIVLTGGENIEPVPIENKLKESLFIDNVIVLGQDMKYLGALIVPNLDELVSYAAENNLSYENKEHLIEIPEVHEKINEEISGLVCHKTGFRAFERIFRFKIISNTFEVGRELSGKQDLMRHKINKIYKKEISGLFK